MSSSDQWLVLAVAIAAVGVGSGLGFIWFARRRLRSQQPKDLEGGLHHGISYTASLRTTRPDSHLTAFPPSISETGTSHWCDPDIVVSRIPLEKLFVDALVSRGGFGEVYRGSYHGQRVAIKTLLPANRKNLKHINAFLGEVKIMSAIEHERVVQFVGVAWDSLRDLCMVTEFMDGGDLHSLLTRFKEDEHRSLGFDGDKLRIAMHVAHALTYLHSLPSPVVHRDLKSRNILLSSQLDAKLTDFGISREMGNQSTMTAGVGTSLWMAPEVMMGERYDEKSDIFSFGIVLTELDSHELPYAGCGVNSTAVTARETAILHSVAMGWLGAQFSDMVQDSMRELGLRCLALDPKDRPTAAEVLYALQTEIQQQSIELPVLSACDAPSPVQ